MGVNGVPEGLGELYTLYWDYICRLVRKSGWFPPQDVEDTASEIMTRLCERDVIGMFDPGKTFCYGGREIPARFKTFLTGHVNRYILGMRDKAGRRDRREPLLADRPVGSGLQTWAEIFGGEVRDDYSHLDAQEWVRGIREYLAAIPPRSERDRCDLLALFDEILAEIGRDGAVRHDKIQERFGISATSSYAWMTRLRQVLRDRPVLGRRLVVPAREVIEARPAAVARWQGEMAAMSPRLRGVTVAQARQAIAVLGGVKPHQTPHVLGPLERAGSPLAAMDYHRVARAELAMFPELRIPAGSHRRPAPHVLSAVVHYLDRVAELQPVPADV